MQSSLQQSEEGPSSAYEQGLLDGVKLAQRRQALREPLLVLLGIAIAMCLLTFAALMEHRSKQWHVNKTQERIDARQDREIEGLKAKAETNQED